LTDHGRAVRSVLGLSPFIPRLLLVGDGAGAAAANVTVVARLEDFMRQQ
jgi:hypothetical protein